MHGHLKNFTSAYLGQIIAACDNKVCFVSSTIHSEINFRLIVEKLIPGCHPNTLSKCRIFPTSPFKYRKHFFSFDTKLKLNLTTHRNWEMPQLTCIILFISKCQAWHENDILKPLL